MFSRNSIETSAELAMDYAREVEERASIARIGVTIGATLLSATAYLGLVDTAPHAEHQAVPAAHQVEFEPALPPTSTSKQLESTPIKIPKELPSPESLPRANRIQREPMRHELEGRLQKVPSLRQLANMSPNIAIHYLDWERQEAHINWLDSEIDVNPDKYERLRYDDSRMGAFNDSTEYGTRIIPSVIVPHTTGHIYPKGDAGADRFVAGLERDGLSSNYFIRRDGSKIYRFYHEDTHMTGGAKGMNSFAVNVEAETDTAVPSSHVIYDITPEELDQMVMTVVQLARRYNLGISEYTVIGHVAGDILFVNTSFNEVLGTISNMRKFDMPQELVRVIIKHAQVLDRQLG